MKNIENIAVRGYMTKEVDVRAQILFLIIPIAGYYAWYRINLLLVTTHGIGLTN